LYLGGAQADLNSSKTEPGSRPGDMPSYSVIMPLYRPGRFFRSTLESVLNQTARDFELIIVEDPSPEAAYDIAADLLEDPRVNYSRNPHRTSLPRQHNQALRAARGPFIARVDGDDVYDPDKMRLQLRYLDAHPDVFIVGSNLRIIDAEGHDLGLRRYPEQHAAIVRAMHRENPIANPSVMFRREVYDRIGGWREDGNTAAQDYEWFSRAAAAGFVFANVQRPLMGYRLHTAAVKNTRLHETIVTTIHVKQKYWRASMSPMDVLRMRVEKLLLWLPSWLVYRLLLLIRFRTFASRPKVPRASRGR
jgi:glycosyltransferase involved in cell wall biosynthesis